MAHVAREMQRDEYFRGIKMPLLIGGATTSRAHTAVKIDPHYDGPVVYVADASRSVAVMQSLTSPDQRESYIDQVAADYERVRKQNAKKKGVPMLRLAAARANKMKVGFDGDRAPVRPKFIGRRTFKNIDLGLLAQYIDWGPFFQTWDLAGAYPAILDDDLV